MISVQINNSTFFVKADLSIIESCKFIGIILPRFCYHEKLSVAANCRMCLVEIEKTAKPVTACSSSFLANSVTYTNTPFVKKARENIIEALLLNHPLDCPICDQAGECDLQEQVMHFGSSQSRFFHQPKRVTTNKDCGPLIKTIMTRCIHCTRCVRFASEIAGVDILGTLNRGVSTEIGTYISTLFNSEISGNVIDLCPVGALTSNFYSFELRPWELYSVESIDLSDSLGSNIYLNFKSFEDKSIENLVDEKKYHYQAKSLVRILPKINEDLNDNWISDRARFSFDSLKSNRLDQELSFSDFEYKFPKKPNSNFCYPLPSTTSPISFIIDENIDLEMLTLLNKLRQKYLKVNIFSIDKPRNRSNLYSFWDFNKVSTLNLEIKNCFLFTSNIKTESVLLATKLKNKSLNQNINFISMGLFFNKTTFLTNFVNLKIQNIINLVEGKDRNYSTSIITEKNNLFCFGESFITRCAFSYNSILSFIKKISPSSIVYQINKKSNTSSFSFLNIKYLNKKSIQNCKTTFFYNLDLNFKVNRILANLYHNSELISNTIFGLKNSLFWFTSHKPLKNLFFTNFKIIPSLTMFESKGTHLNLEGRPQQNSQLSIFFVQSLKDRLGQNFSIKLIKDKKIFSFSDKFFVIRQNAIRKIEDLPELSFLYELVQNYNLFDTTKKNFSNNIKFDINIFKIYGKCYKYGFKASILDVYTLNLYLKNSPRMAECSRQSRKISNNFF